jgi:hypothetical protein
MTTGMTNNDLSRQLLPDNAVFFVFNRFFFKTILLRVFKLFVFSTGNKNEDVKNENYRKQIAQTTQEVLGPFHK